MANSVPGVRTNVPTGQAHQQGPIPLPLVATLPPAAQAQQNQQLLAQFPQMMRSVQAAAQGAPASPVAVVIAPIGQSTDRLQIKVHTPGAGDASAAQAVCVAVTAYIRSCCGDGVIQSTLGGITLKPLDDAARKKVDAALHDLNTLGALVQHLGGNTQTFTQLLQRPKWTAELQAFTGDQPKVAMHQVGNTVLVVVSAHADENSLVAAANLLFAASGNEQAMSLLCEAILKGESSNLFEIAQPFVAGMLQGHFPADASRAAGALRCVMWSHITLNDFAPCMRKAVERLFHAECPKEALSLALRQLPDETRMSRKVDLLKIVFAVALQVRNTDIAQAALNALGELDGALAQAAYDMCAEQAKASNQQATQECDPHRQALEEANFTFEIDLETGALTSQSKFDPAVHTDNLLGYAGAVIQASADPHFIAQFATRVAEFLIGHFAALPRAAKLQLAGVCAKLIDKAHSPGAIVQKLQQAIEAELLSSAIAAAKQASSAKDGLNALVWLLTHKDRLFGSLQSSGTGVEQMITAALTELGAPADFEHTIDEAAARATLKASLSPSIDTLLKLIQETRSTPDSEPTQASRRCYVALVGNTVHLDVLNLPQLLDGPQRTDREDAGWLIQQSALESILNGMQFMLSAGADPVQLAYLHNAVIDALVTQNGKRKLYEAEARWCNQTVKAMQEDQAMLAEVWKADRQAIQWLYLLGLTQNLWLTQTKDVPDAISLLKEICQKPGTTLDRRLATTIRRMLKDLLDTVFDPVRMRLAGDVVALYGSLPTAPELSDDPLPLPLKQLGKLIQAYKSALNRNVSPQRPDPGVGDLNVLRGILTALVGNGSQDAATAFLTDIAQITECHVRSVVFSGYERLLPQALQVAQIADTGFVPTHGPSLAFIGYVHLAKLLHTQNDLKGMLLMLVAALAHLPTDAAARRSVLPEFTDFINSLRQAGELPDPLAQLMREKGV